MYSMDGVRHRRGAPDFAKEIRLGSKRALNSLRNVRSRSFNSLADVRKGLIDEAKEKIRSELKSVAKGAKEKIKTEWKSVAAEAEEFIASPHLLFRPVSMILSVAFPLLIPLLFIPIKILVLYILCFFLWYLTLAAYFATEVAMRPPWYRTGLSLMHQPSYWKQYIHNPAEDMDMEYENVEFKGGDGRTLRAWFIPAPKHARTLQRSKTMICCIHGAGRDRRAFLRHSEVLLDAGYSTLLFDLSEHGLSDGTQRGFSFGYREKFDVISAVKFLREVKHAENVVAIGTSTGASSAILAEEIEPSSINVIIAENPFTRPADLFCLHLNDTLKNYLSQNEHHIWRRITFWYFSRILLLRSGHGLRNSGALDAAVNVACPLFVLHGTSDDVVPISHGRMIYEAAKSKMKNFWEASEAIHCGLFDKYPEEWTERVLSFINLHTPQDSNEEAAEEFKRSMALEDGDEEAAEGKLTLDGSNEKVAEEIERGMALEDSNEEAVEENERSMAFEDSNEEATEENERSMALKDTKSA